MKPTNKKYLVVPIWNQAPTYVTEANWRPTRVIGKGFFIRDDQIAELHEMIPRKVIYAIASLSAAVGRLITLDGIVLISDAFDGVFVLTTETRKLFDLEWGKAWTINISNDDKRILKQMFDANDLSDISSLDILGDVKNRVEDSMGLPYEAQETDFIEFSQYAIRRGDLEVAYRLLETGLVSDNSETRQQFRIFLEEHPELLLAARNTFIIATLHETLRVYKSQAAEIEKNRLLVYEQVTSQEDYLTARDNYCTVFGCDALND